MYMLIDLRVKIDIDSIEEDGDSDWKLDDLVSFTRAISYVTEVEVRDINL